MLLREVFSILDLDQRETNWLTRKQPKYIKVEQTMNGAGILVAGLKQGIGKPGSTGNRSGAGFYASPKSYL